LRLASGLGRMTGTDRIIAATDWLQVIGA